MPCPGLLDRSACLPPHQHCRHAEQAPSEAGQDLNKPVVICGFGELGQMVANIIMAPPQPRSSVPPVPYVAYDIHADRVNEARGHGFNCLYGDASRAQVLPFCSWRSAVRMCSSNVARHRHCACA